jgi:CheY-like chemotaxis protein
VKIFLLEDDPIYEDIIKEDLRQLGHEVDTWGCVDGADKKIMEGGYDLLVIDIMIPQSKDEPGKEVRDGGIKVLESLSKQDYPLPVTLFCSVSGYEENEDRISNLELNNNIQNNIQDIKIYFRKPYLSDEFLQTVQKLEQFLAQ